MISYENFWRPPYEGIAGITWILGSVVCFGIGRFQDTTIGMIGILSIPMAAIGLYRIGAVLRNWHFKAKLWTGKPAFMNVKDVLSKQRKVKATWLGKGFIWNPMHARRINEISSLEEHETKPPAIYMAMLRMIGAASKHVSKGYHYVHGVGEGEGDIYVSDDALGGHTYIVGTSGSGKTRTLEVLIAQAIARGGSVIVVDPKGDTALLDRCYAETCRRGSAEDFHYCSPTYARNSVRLNLLSNYTRLTQIADRVAALLPAAGNAHSFKAFGWRALNVTCEGLNMSGLSINLTNLKRYVEGDIDGLIVRSCEAYFAKIDYIPTYKNWKTDVERIQTSLSAKSRRGTASSLAVRASALATYYIQNIQEFHGHSTIDSMLSILHHDREHYSKLIQNLLPILEQLTSGEMATLLSPDYEDASDNRPIVSLAQIVHRSQVLYVNLETLADSVVGQAFGSLLLADLTSVAADRCIEFDESAAPVSVFVDEAAELMAEPEPLIQNLNKGRSAGFRLYIASQTLADFVAKMGDQAMAMQVLGNTNTTIAFRIQDPETREFVSNKFGETRHVHVEAQKMNTTYNPAEDMDWGSSHSKRATQKDIPVVDEELLGKLPDLHYFANLPGGMRVKGRVPLFRLPVEERFVRPVY